jgi:hypothetical protein
MDGAEGVIAMDASTAGVTVRFTVLDTEPDVAEIVIDPVPTEVARPAVVGAPLMVATVESEDAQWTEAVTSCVLASLYVPTAVNCCVVPSGMEAESGDTAMETSTAGFTCTFSDPVSPPLAAVSVADPTLSAVISPVALTVAIELSEELQVALAEMSFVVSSEYVAMAASCCVVPLASDSGEGVTSIEVITAGLTVRTVVPLTPAELAAMVVVPVASV